jgi:dinuclear metal center YbgI/SA1388 family protein
MITLKEFCQYTKNTVDPDTIADYCPNGLQVEGNKEITRFASAVSASIETIKEAIKAGVQLLLVHHGMFWKSDPYPIVGMKKEKIRLLMENGISLLAYHLPLDVHQQFGNNWKAASDMQWENLEDFANLGVKGSFPGLSVEDFQKQLEIYYEHPAHTALGGNKTVKSAALVSGGAHKLIDAAVNDGVDCFITGSFDEPIWHIAHEEGINFFALGHSATERIGPKTLGEYLGKEMGLEHLFIDVRNPF